MVTPCKKLPAILLIMSIGFVGDNTNKGGNMSVDFSYATTVPVAA